METKKRGSDSLKGFFQSGRQLKYGEGEIVLSPGIEPQGVYWIEDGFIKVYSISRRGEIYLHIIYKAGEIFPLAWALKDRQYDVFYESVTDTRLRRVLKSDFLEFIKSHNEASLALLAQFTDQFDIHINRVESLQHRHADERIAHRLLTLARRFGRQRNGEIIIDAPITHQLIADSVNLTRESVSREVEKLEKRAVIRYAEHRIVIRDPQALARIFD